MKGNKKFLFAIFLIAILAGTSIFFYLQNKSFKTNLQFQNLLITQQAQAIDSIKKNSQAELMSHLLNKIDTELKANPNRILSDETIDRIKVVCYTFKPYLRLEHDSLSTKLLSPERGQLLLLLAKMNIDTGTLDQILLKSSFEYADLRSADLSGTYLRGVNLRGADLQDANLKGVNLSKANLSFAILWGANLNQAFLKETDLSRADLRWANLNEAILENADLKEANLISAQMRKANLNGAILQWADCREAFLNEADLSCADMYRTRLDSSQLTGAKMTDANLVLAHLVKTNLSNADFTNANLTDLYVIEPNWLALLKEWHVSGTQIAFLNYKIMDVSSNEEILYQVKKL